MSQYPIIIKQSLVAEKKRDYYILILSKNACGYCNAVRFTKMGRYDGTCYDRIEKFSDQELAQHLNDKIPYHILMAARYHLIVLNDISKGNYTRAIKMCRKAGRKKLETRFARNNAWINAGWNKDQKSLLIQENEIIQLAMRR